MKGLTGRVKSFLPQLKNSLLAETTFASFDFIRSKGKILRELQFCLKEQNLVGIYCPLLGNGMFLVGVENIIADDSGLSVITFFPQDMSGHRLARRSIELNEIDLIVPFNNPYVDPMVPGVKQISRAH